MSRALPTWEGTNDDSKVPARVRLRVFLSYSGACYHCKRILRPGDDWALDHIVALINGGSHEEKNLAPICEPCHTLKTAKDVGEKAATYKTRLKHYGLREPKHPMPGSRKSKWKRLMNGKVVLR